MTALTPAARGVVITIVVLLSVSLVMTAAALVPAQEGPGTATIGAGVAVTAFLLGVRHAFDADHIAAIDNTSRKLTADGRDPSSVGLWFALGHSTVVVATVALITAGVGAVAAQVGSDHSPLTEVTRVWGPSVSSVFLLAVAGVNLAILVRMLRRGDEWHGESRRSHGGGPVSSFLARSTSPLDAPWKLFVVGLLFGLGFDTASTIAVLVLAAGAGATLPWYAALSVPLLFTAGMAACDGINGILSARIYAWSVERPAHRRRYNVALLSLSISVASVVGVVGLCAVLVDVVGVRWAAVRAVADIDLDLFGFVIVAVLVGAGTLGWVLSRRRRTRLPRPT